MDWCNKSNRGILCSAEGQSFHKDDEPHTALEIQEILGPFWLILSPRSELLAIEQLPEFDNWMPLGEYSNQFGIAVKSQRGEKA